MMVVRVNIQNYSDEVKMQTTRLKNAAAKV